MIHKSMLPVLWLAVGIVCLCASEAAAQSIFGGGGRRGDGSTEKVIRLIIMIGSIGLGFGLGWLFSPAAREIRQVALYLGAFLLFLVGVAVNGPLGWSSALVVAVIGFSMALGYWTNGILGALQEVPTTFGSSRWANEDDLAENNVFGEDGIRLGKYQRSDGQVEKISYKGDRHLLTVAPTRSGKGTTQIIPNLLTYEGSMLVIDPKGENALITAKRRQEIGQEVHIVDPWGIVGVEGIETSAFNPLDWLDKRAPDITENSMILADALVVGGNHSDSFWEEEAKALLQGLLLYVASSKDEDGQRHLGRVRDILVSSGPEQQDVFQKMAKSAHHIISSTGHRCIQKDEKLLSNVIASAQAQTHFLDSERLRSNLMTSSFKFEDLKAKPMTIYLVLPADRLNTFGRWLRLLVQQAVTVNARDITTKPKKPVLFILDEFAALGRLSMIEQAYGLMAGFGLQLWCIIQDFNQLERIYDKGWQSFIANAGMINYFGSSDKQTAEYFSSLCGDTTVWNFSSALANVVSGQSSSSTETDTRSASNRKLAYPDELMRLHGDTQIAFIDNMHPLRAQKVAWFENIDLKQLGTNLHTPSIDTAGQSPAKDILNEELSDV
jgi:type IV secretion system protein VirD4